MRGQPVLSPLNVPETPLLFLPAFPWISVPSYHTVRSLAAVCRGCVLACGLGCRRTRFPLVWVPVGVTRSVEGARVRWSAVRFAYGHRARRERTARWGGLVWGLRFLRLLLLIFPNPPTTTTSTELPLLLYLHLFHRLNEDAAILLLITLPKDLLLNHAQLNISEQWNNYEICRKMSTIKTDKRQI